MAQRSVSLTAELDAELEQRAEREDGSASSIVRRALRREFKRDPEDGC